MRQLLLQYKLSTMKVIVIIVSVLIIAFVAAQIYFMSSSKNIESYPYSTIREYEDFEIRSYEASLFTSVKVSSNGYSSASSVGFQVLGGYIFGANEKNEKIAMTSPVAMSLEDTMTMMFMVPKQYNKSTLPKPNQDNIEFRDEPAKTVAAITFGGWADDDKIERYKKQLQASLEANNIKYSNRFFLLGYNAPYEMINRRNEVIVELEEGFTL